MSININVNGMKCYADRAAAEKRKINRLLMVREQSNELAHSLRNKVREAQKQELKKIQIQNKKELGEWKRRNHCQIQAKIDQCLANIGNAHIAAVDASCEENEFLKQEREEKDLMAAMRGKKAMLQVQRERERQTEERLLKKKRHGQKTTSTQADFLTQHRFSEILAQKRNQNLSDEDQDEESETVFKSKPNIHKHSIKIDTNYNAQNYTSHSVDSSNNCDSDEVEELQEDLTQNEKSESDEVEFDQIKKLLKQRSKDVPIERVEEKIVYEEEISLSDTSSSAEIIPPKKSVKKPSPKKKGILKKSPNQKKTKLKANKSPIKKKVVQSSTDDNRVRYVDFTKSKYETSYIPSKDLIKRSEKTKLNAKQEAQIQTDDQMISKKINADILKQLTEIRSQEAIEKEKIRRDYERLRLELDELSKLEQEARAKTNISCNLTRDQLIKKEDVKQKKMNEAAENAMKGNIITCPPVDASEKSSINQKSNVNNVATLNLSAQQSDSKKKKGNEELNTIVKVERLKDLLEKINHQKRLLLNEIEKSDDIPGPDLEKVMECLEKLEKEKAQLDSENKTKDLNKNLDEQNLTERERKVREREQRLENRLRELFKKQKETTVSSSSSCITVSPPKSVSICSSSTSQEKKVVQPPVEIIIKVQQPKSPHRKTKKSYRCLDTLNREPGRVYPKTPIKKKKESQVFNEEIKKISDKLNDIEKDKQQQQTQTSPTNSEAPKPILKNSQIKQISIPPVQEKSNIPMKNIANDSEDFSISTVYRELPPKIHLNEQTKQNKPHSLNPALTYYIKRLLGMNKNIGNQLNVDVSSVSTPGSSTINTSGNVSSVNELNFDNNRMDRLQKFIDDNYSFLSEINESLERVQLQQHQEVNFEKVQGVWGEVLRKNKPQTHDNQSKASSSKIKTAPTQTKTVSSKSAPTIPIKNKPQLPQNVLKQKQPTNQAIKITQNPFNLAKSRPTTVPIHTRPQITTEEMEKVTKYLESKMMTNYKEYTDKCQKRINELTKMMEQVRQEKLKLIENSLSSNECNNFTEYKDIVQNNAGSSDQKESPSNRDDPPSEEINNILKTQSRPFGMSKDSGIASSRPVTSSDFRDSPDVRVTSEENPGTNVFQPIAPRVRVTTAEGDSETIKNVSQIIKQQQEDKKKQQVLMKPPLSIKSFSPQVDKMHEGHELSTIVEIETPTASKVNIVPEESVNVGDLNSFPNFEEYAAKKLKSIQNPEIESSFPGMNSLVHALPDMNIKTFIGPQDYGIDDLPKEHGSSSNSSLLDIQEELKNRNIFEKSFELFIDEVADDDLVKEAAIDNEDDKTTPTLTHNTSEPISPKKKQAQSSIVIKTNENATNIEIISTPTKSKKQKKIPTLQSPKSNDTLSGIQEIENDLQGVGMIWAANVLRRVEETQQKNSSSSSDGKKEFVKIDLGTSSSSSEGRPLNLREFLTRELISKTNYLSDDSSLSSQFLKSLLNASSGSTNSSKSSNPKSDSISNVKLRTSTPVRVSSEYVTTTKTAASSQLFVGTESVSTVKDSSEHSNEKSDKDNNELNP